MAILSPHGVRLSLDERFLGLGDSPQSIHDVAAAGAVGVLLPGVDGDVAALYFFDPRVAFAVQADLMTAARDLGAEPLVVADEQFRKALRNGS